MKKHPFFSWLLCACLCLPVHAQTFYRPLSFTGTGLEVYSHFNDNVYTGIYNPAALAEMKTVSVGFSAEQRFLLGLDDCSAAIAAPTAKGDFGLILDYTGMDNYSENHIGLAFARPLGHK